MWFVSCGISDKNAGLGLLFNIMYFDPYDLKNLLNSRKQIFFTHVLWMTDICKPEYPPFRAGVARTLSKQGIFEGLWGVLAPPWSMPNYKQLSYKWEFDAS